MVTEIHDIAERAETAGISMAAVCRRAGIAQSTPSRVRKGLWEPKPRTVRRLNDALTELLGERGGAGL